MKALFIWICLLAVFCTYSISAEAAKEVTKSPQNNVYTTTLHYDVYAGGVHALDAVLLLKRDLKQYDIKLVSATRGFLKKMANWSGQYISKGRISKDKTYPTVHTGASTWKKSTETKTFKYDGHGKFLSYKVSEEGKDTTPSIIDSTLAKGTTDILSSTLRLMMMIPKAKVCDGNELIFDGDRNFELKYSGKELETLKKSDYNIYAGETVVCKVEVKPKDGKWRKKPRGWLSIQEQGRNLGDLPTIWFGKVEGQPDLYVPVKIRVKTDYGTLFMHLTSVKTD